jgi:phospholipid N-methyltransferase
MSRQDRNAILAAVAAALAAGAPLLAIQYSQARRRDLEQVFGEVTATGERRNWPPAVLFCCRDPKAGAAA